MRSTWARPTLNSGRTAFSGEGAVSDDGLVFGTYLHGLFMVPAAAEALLSYLYAQRGLTFTGIDTGQSEDPYDLLADHFEAHLQMDRLLTPLQRSHPGDPGVEGLSFVGCKVLDTVVMVQIAMKLEMTDRPGQTGRCTAADLGGRRKYHRRDPSAGDLGERNPERSDCAGGAGGPGRRSGPGDP